MEDIIFSDTLRRFTPRRIRGLKLWLDASRISGLTDGDPITTWSDLSGNGNDATQATAAKKPLYKVNIVNGRPVVRFDGTDDTLKTVGFTLNQPETVCLVFNDDNIVDGKYVFDGVSGDTMGFYSAVAPARLIMFAGGNGPSKNLSTGFHIYVATYDGASSTLYKDGGTAATGNAGAANGGGLTLGSYGSGLAGFSQIDAPEALLYNRVLSDAERQSVERHLGSKYSISVG